MAVMEIAVFGASEKIQIKSYKGSSQLIRINSRNANFRKGEGDGAVVRRQSKNKSPEVQAIIPIILRHIN